MSSNPSEIKFALAFPQGHILFMAAGGIYFLPNDGDRAYMVYGERKELFGKNAVSVQGNRQTSEEGYSVVYEFAEDGTLYDARLVTRQQTMRGSLAAQNVVDTISAGIGQGAIMLLTPDQTRPESISNVARFDDGRLLVQVSKERALYIGTPGNYEKVDARLHAQGGSTMIYRLGTGGTVYLPWSFGGPPHGEKPKFEETELSYLHNPTAESIGFTLDQGIAPLTPFSAEVLKNAASRGPKPPAM